MEMVGEPIDDSMDTPEVGDLALANNKEPEYAGPEMREEALDDVGSDDEEAEGEEEDLQNLIPHGQDFAVIVPRLREA